MQAQRLRLKIKDLDRERVALLRQAAQRKGALLEGGGRRGELVIRIPIESLGEQVGQSRESRIHLDAAPRASAPAGVRLGVEEMERSRHVSGLHAGDRVAIERKAVAIHVRASET